MAKINIVQRERSVLLKIIFEEPVMDTHSVYFVVEYKYIYQILEQGPDTITNNILAHLQSHSLSEKSTNKMLSMFSRDDDKENLGMDVLE